MYRTRDWRRAQKSRIIKQLARNKGRYYSGNVPNPLNRTYSWIDRKGNHRFFHTWQEVFDHRFESAKLMADNRTTCSAMCCGNPRKWFGEVTRQEAKHKITCKEVL